MLFFKSNTNKNINELLKGSSISLITKLVGMAFGYAAMLFITNKYGAGEWGTYSLCLTILSIAVVVTKFGFDNSLVRIVGELRLSDESQIKHVLLKAIAIMLVLSLLLISVLHFFEETIVNNIIRKPEFLPYLKLISYCIIPLSALTIISAAFQAYKKILFYMLFQTALINIFFFILLVVNHFFNFEVIVFELYLYAIIFSLLVAIIAFAFSLRKRLLVSKENGATQFKLNRIVKISFPMLLSSSFALLMGWSDILMLSYYKTTSDIGIYNSSLKLAAISGITLIAINAIASPKFVEFYSTGDFKSLKEVVQNSTKMIFIVTTPVLLVLIIFSKEILGFFGNEFVVGYLALIYLCLSRFVNAISGSVGYIMQMTDQQRTYQNVIIIAFFINVILNFILIPQYSYTGAAIASSIAMIFWNITLVLIIKRRLGFWTFYIPFVRI